MNHWVSWAQALDLIQKGALALLAILFMRAKQDELGRDILRKTCDDLRSQIEDRDRVTINQREQITALSGRITSIAAEVQRKESQVLALLDENLAMKREIAQLGRK